MPTEQLTPKRIGLIFASRGQAAEGFATGPPPTSSVADVIGRNRNDVCTLAYDGLHGSEWLRTDESEQHARRFKDAAMGQYTTTSLTG